jgi:hypothetical protein
MQVAEDVMSELAVALLFAALISPSVPASVSAPQDPTTTVACPVANADSARRERRGRTSPAAPCPETRTAPQSAPAPAIPVAAR